MNNNSKAKKHRENVNSSFASKYNHANCELILGNSNKRFSGVTSTMLQNFEIQKNIMPTLIMGQYHVDNKQHCTSFWRVAFLCRGFANGKWRIFHARRNNEVVQAFILKKIFRVKIKIVFTSTAQRNHSRFTKWLIKHVDGLLSTCDAAARFLERKPDHIIAHGIRADHFFPATEKDRIKYFNQWNIATPYVCGIFGRVREQKGVHLFVRACIENFKKNHEFTALIIGAIKKEDEAFVENLKKEIAQAGLQSRIRFLQEQPFENLPKLFSIMDLVCALSKVEGFGLTVLEAMSSASAIIATRAGAWPEIVRHDVDGKLIEIDNQEAVISAMDELMNNNEQRKKMGTNAQERILQSYCVQDESKKLCAYFHTLQKR